jgi:hypothetical protein
LKKKFVYANWDVDELKAMAKGLEAEVTLLGACTGFRLQMLRRSPHSAS